MVRYFEISDIKIIINGDYEIVFEKFSKFETTAFDNPDLEIELKEVDYIEKPEGKMLSDEDIKWVCKPEGQDGYYFYAPERHKHFLLTMADVDSQFKKVSLCYINNNSNVDDTFYNFYTEATRYFSLVLIGLIYRFRLLKTQGIIIHSSTIAWNGKGIMFTAPSGTGKSTQARLWQEHIGEAVQIINDDTPAVKIKNGVPLVYGTPWSGSDSIHDNTIVPIAAIVVLEQAPENKIERLSVQEATIKLMPRVFLPYFDKDMLNTAMNIFEDVVSRVPVYYLKCKPDKEAVELVYECVR